MKSIFGKSPGKVAINYVPHDGQKEISDAVHSNFLSENPAFLVEIIASRGWGKTLYMVAEVLVPYLETHPGAKVMWVAPIYLTALSPIEDVFKGQDELSGNRWIEEFDREGNRVWEFTNGAVGPTLKWWNGATVSFKSADSPDSIVSRGYNLIIMDEAAMIPELVFQQQIMGTARKQGIKVFIISSPRGKTHWTYKIFLKGQDPTEHMYLSFRQAFDKNPHFSPVLAKAMLDLPEWLIRQEYYAEFLDSGSAVFEGLNHVVFGEEIFFDGPQQEWSSNITDVIVSTVDKQYTRKSADRRFIVGLDLAKSVDYTVLWAMDLDTGDPVYYRRLNKMDYRNVLQIATDVCKKYNHAELIFDATGVGAGLADVLNNYDVIAHPFVFTNESKNEIVNKLSLSIQYQEIKLPNIATVLNELKVFTYTITRTGKISYGAPSGFHDDIVMSLALANWYRKENAGSEEIGMIEDIVAINEVNRRGRPGSFLDEMYEDND